MKRKLAAGIIGLFLAIRLFPAAAIFWAEWISLPLLGGLRLIGSSFPFAILEWLPGLLLGLGLFRKRFLKMLCCMMLALLLGWLGIWYPLYFLPQTAHPAGNAQVSRLCEDLIDELNAHESDFPVPDDLPAKFISFPEWMDALNISGICSFLTGEALVTPKLDEISLPFVAVHEDMHLRGHAGEGAANIAAWKECISRGGSYGLSARIWALRYGMGILRRNAPVLYETNLLRMNHATLQAYRRAGGAYTPGPQPVFLRRLHGFLGIAKPVQDYENLALYLAAEYAG